jgi:hypothetical protein
VALYCGFQTAQAKSWRTPALFSCAPEFCGFNFCGSSAGGHSAVRIPPPHVRTENAGGR